VILNHCYWNEMSRHAAERECISYSRIYSGFTFFFSFVCAKNAHNMNIPMLFRSYESHETHPGCKIWEAARVVSSDVRARLGLKAVA